MEKEGYLYHCMSDYSMVKHYNEDLGFKRDKTIMEGDEYCNHCYYWKSKE